MIKMLGVEWKRVIRSKRFWFALGIGILCSIFQAIHYKLSGIIQYIYAGEDYPIVCWVSYLGRDIQLFYHSLYFLIFPIIAVLPFAVSYYDDWKSGYYKMLLLKSRRKTYAIAKYLVAFVSGGLVVTLPLMFSLFIHAGIVPTYPPNELSLQAVPLDGDMLCNVFYDYPLVYAIIFWGIDFLVGGCIAGMTLCFSIIAKKKYSAYIFGFVFCILESTILYQFDSARWAFSNIVDPINVSLNGNVVFIKIIGTIIVSFILFVSTLARKDVL